VIKPVSSYQSESYKKYCLDSCRESLGFSDSSDIEIVIDNAYESDAEKGKNNEICFIAIPKSIVDS
jgi:hypothetical protein